MEFSTADSIASSRGAQAEHRLATAESSAAHVFHDKVTGFAVVFRLQVD
jgi:hypothetical protein